jgi:hypothetical protein
MEYVDDGIPLDPLFEDEPKLDEFGEDPDSVINIIEKEDYE